MRFGRALCLLGALTLGCDATPGAVTDAGPSRDAAPNHDAAPSQDALPVPRVDGALVFDQAVAPPDFAGAADFG